MSTPINYKTRQDASLQKAKSSLANKDDDKAMRYFKRACIYCDCNKTFLQDFFKATGSISDADVPLSSCHCREIMSLDPNDDDKQAIYKLATKPCACGSGVKSCGIQAHIDGLNGMAAICGRRKAYKDACKYASLLILIAPDKPTGYLRLAKSMRLQDASEGTDTRKRWEWIYSQLRGIDPAKLKNLVNVIRVDIISKSPPEIQGAILKYLSYRDLCRCMRVSKAWEYATFNASLWRHLEFIKLGPSPQIRPFPKGTLNDIISRRSRNLAQSLVISGLLNFAIGTGTLSSILKGLPHLQSLSLRDLAPHTAKPRISQAHESSYSFPSVVSVVCRDAHTSLKCLHIEKMYGRVPHINSYRNVMPSAINFASSLRELKLVNFEFPSALLSGAPSLHWPNLETLCIINARGGLYLDSLIAATPFLKDVCLDNLTLDRTQFGRPCSWKNLERFVLTHTLVRYCPISSKSQTLRSLELHGLGKTLSDTMSQDDMAGTTWDKLEHFRHVSGGLNIYSSSSTRTNIMRIIKPSCVNGTLRSLEIDFEPRLCEDVDKTIIHSLGCYNMIPPSIHPGGHPGHLDEFLSWLDGFPNVNTLGIFPEGGDTAWVMVAKVVHKLDEKSLVKTIYTNVLYGVYRDQILEEAAKKGIQVIYADRIPEPKLQPLPSIAPRAV